MRNHLKNQTSPYLLQHAENPVDWYPWCEEAFERAKREGKRAGKGFLDDYANQIFMMKSREDFICTEGRMSS